MSYNENVTLIKYEDGYYFTSKCNEEVKRIIDKHKGLVNIDIRKPIQPGTDEQNRAMHSMLSEYYKTGMSSAPDGMTLDVFKVYMKLLHGPCYVMTVSGVDTRVPKSWSAYSKLERSDFIDALINEITQSGALTESKKLQEIMNGMMSNNELKR